MDTAETRSNALPKLQESLLEQGKIARTGEAKEKIRKVRWKRYYEQNRSILIARSQQWYHENRERRKAYDHEYYQKNKTAKIQYATAWQKENSELHRGYVRKKNLKLRIAVITAYGGPICKCCYKIYSLEHLSIDHLNNDGAYHRKEVGNKIYYWLKKNKFPQGFQVLCHNCNLAKGFYGQCPHQLLKTPIDLFFEYQVSP